MAASNAEKPAPAATGSGLQGCVQLGNEHSLLSAKINALQALRAAHLARRYALTPAMAGVVASIVWEARR
jgi:hypothetical protein